MDEIEVVLCPLQLAAEGDARDPVLHGAPMLAETALGTCPQSEERLAVVSSLFRAS